MRAGCGCRILLLSVELSLIVSNRLRIEDRTTRCNRRQRGLDAQDLPLISTARIRPGVAGRIYRPASGPTSATMRSSWTSIPCRSAWIFGNTSTTRWPVRRPARGDRAQMGWGRLARGAGIDDPKDFVRIEIEAGARAGHPGDPGPDRSCQDAGRGRPSAFPLPACVSQRSRGGSGARLPRPRRPAHPRNRVPPATESLRASPDRPPEPRAASLHRRRENGPTRSA